MRKLLLIIFVGLVATAAAVLAAVGGFVAAMFLGGKPSLPNVGEQFSAAFSAPLPFIFALLAIVVPIAVLIWGVMEWPYRRVIDGTEIMRKLAATQNEVAKERIDALKEELAARDRRTCPGARSLGR
jgi:hypothetical protein